MQLLFAAASEQYRSISFRNGAHKETVLLAGYVVLSLSSLANNKGVAAYLFEAFFLCSLSAEVNSVVYY